MAREFDPYRLSNLRIFLFSMVIFLIIVGFLVAILYSQIASAFLTNPGLNGLIAFVLLAGIVFVFLQVLQLFPEVAWVNNFREGGSDMDLRREPRLLAPMRTLLGQSGQDMSITTQSMRSILDSIGNRLDESRDISRYLIGLLVFLGLLGTFWGLLSTISSIGDTIRSLNPGSGSSVDLLDTLKTSLSRPLDGMGTAFSSSLFGLAGSLILGFLDLQAGRAQTRFYTELENWLSSITDMNSELAAATGATGSQADQIQAYLEELTRSVQQGGNTPRATAAMANLAESIQGMVQHMRNDQKMMHEQMQAQAEQQRKLGELLVRINRFFERAAQR